MKKIAVLILFLLFLISFSACKLQEMDPNTIVEKFNQVVEVLGRSQITKDKDLVGTRITDDDQYTGTYFASCEGTTGRDVVFGGSSVQERKVKIYGNVKISSGRGDVRIRIGEKVEIITLDENGDFEQILTLDGGGNYIMLDYENFTGSVNLYSEYPEET